MDRNAQAATEFILIIGAIIVIVMILLIAYKNYLADLSREIKNEELNNLEGEIEKLGQYFK